MAFLAAFRHTQFARSWPALRSLQSSSDVLHSGLSSLLLGSRGFAQYSINEEVTGQQPQPKSAAQFQETVPAAPGTVLSIHTSGSAVEVDATSQATATETAHISVRNCNILLLDLLKQPTCKLRAWPRR